MFRFLLGLSLFAGLVFLTGCGDSDKPKLVTVTGKVMYKNQGLSAGSIIFHPDASNSFQKDKPSSLLQVDGSFTMKTFPYGDGIAPGKYKVTLAPELANRIQKPMYSDPAKTPWSVDVPETGLVDKVFEVK